MDIEALRSFFMWCTIISLGLLVFWSVMILVAKDWIYKVHGKWFPMPRETFNVVMYAFLGACKIFFAMFILIPYIALVIIS
ncbi:MAG: hypothetical protein JW936_00500 [Sedimentisphaerales bacterium]|nr:hypothetical protein [Sedimentisphaerales bacterium]